jgi:hypothetical protein
MAQRIRGNDSVIVFAVIGLANDGVKCSIEIASAAQDLRSFMCYATLWMDPKGIETWMGLVQAIMTQPGCERAALRARLGQGQDTEGRKKAPRARGEDEEEDAYGSDYEGQTW